MANRSISIAIDGNEANVSQRVGSNAYAYELLKALEQLTASRSDIEVSVLLASEPLGDLPSERKGWKYVIFGPSQLWTQIALSLHLFWNQHKYQVFFTPGHYAPRVSMVPYVSSIMDLAFFHFPKQFKRKDYVQLHEWTRYSVKHAAKLIAISEHTKRDIIEQYGFPEKNIAIAYPGISVTKEDVKEKERLEVMKKWKVKHPFLLYVGTLQPRKNLVRLIEAFEQVVGSSGEGKKKAKSFLAPKLDTLQLVIAGKVGWLADEIMQKVQQSPVKDRIILTGYITEREKVVLYKECIATILVGLYEGFGIPALESMCYGSLPIVSSTTSLPEVVGEGGILVNPTDTEDIANGIRHVMDLPAKERAKLLKKGRQQVKKFTWEKAAEVVLDTLLSVAK